MNDLAKRTCEAALACAELGWRILAIYGVKDGKCGCGDPNCEHPAKHPHSRYAPHGCHSETVDGAEICGWFGNGEQVNIAVATGAESGLVVIDIDPRNGGDLAALGALPTTATAATGGGGWHLYFTYPAGTDIRGFSADKTPRLGPGIDVKAKGGYIILPPSQHITGGEYRWTRDPRGGLADLPPRLLAKIVEQPAAKAAPAGEGVIPEGRRNETLTSLAGSMRRKDMSPSAIKAALLVVNAEKCKPPLKEGEVAAIAASIGKKDPAEPDTPPVYRPRVLDLDTLTPRETEWLIPDYVPCAALTIVGGNPGAGKTSFGLDLVTRLSRGWPPVVGGADAAKHGLSVIIANEDSVERVLLKRLRNMDADLSKIKVLADVEIMEDGMATTESFTVEMLTVLDQLIESYPTMKLLLFDNLPDCLGAFVKDNDNKAVRRALRPLNAWADRYNVAIVGNTHLNKRADDAAILRILGSMGYAATARAVLGVSIHPDDAELAAWEKRRIVTPIKESYAPEGDALVFRIDHELQTLLWDMEALPMGADEALSGGNMAKSTTKAESWLKTQLDNTQGAVDSRTLKKRASEYGVCCERTLTRAAAKIGVAKATTGMGESLISWWGKPSMDIEAWLRTAG